MRFWATKSRWSVFLALQSDFLSGENLYELIFILFFTSNANELLNSLLSVTHLSQVHISLRNLTSQSGNRVEIYFWSLTYAKKAKT